MGLVDKTLGGMAGGSKGSKGAPRSAYGGEEDDDDDDFYEEVSCQHLQHSCCVSLCE